MQTTRWFRLSEDILDELLLTGRATFTIQFDDQTEHVVLDIHDTADVEAVYRSEG